MALSRRLVTFGLFCASVAKALDLDTFNGQAQVLGRQRELILSQQQGSDDVKPMRMMADPEADDSDGKCTKKKGCKLGCCGPL
jgi:chitinase